MSSKAGERQQTAFLRREASRLLTERQVRLFLFICSNEGVSQPEPMKMTGTTRSVMRHELRMLAEG